MTQSFEQFKLHSFLLEGLEKLRIVTPTPVQEQVIPAILKGRDVIGQSQTGTGKTLAYALPVLQQIDTSKQEVQALILAPTRELTRQIAGVIDYLAGDTGIDIVLIQGGVDIGRQIQKLRRNPQVIVGTPGRILELILQEKLASHTARFLIIDEADTMLEMGFRDDIEKIFQKVKKDIQIMLFAATFPPKVEGITKNFMKKPLHLNINPAEKVVSSVENVLFRVRNNGKEEALLDLVKIYNPYLGIVFVKKKEQVDELVTQLRQAGVEAEGLHGDMQRGQRKQVMQRFREARSQILVATDIASRGLDVEGVTHIFNFDLPISVDQYVHRIGRTGRAGETGIAVNIITAVEEEKLRRFEDKLDRRFKEMVIKSGSVVEKTGRGKSAVETQNEEKTTRKPKTEGKKFTGPNAKKKAIKEYQQKKKKESAKQVVAKRKEGLQNGPPSGKRGRNKSDR